VFFAFRLIVAPLGETTDCIHYHYMLQYILRPLVLESWNYVFFPFYCSRPLFSTTSIPVRFFSSGLVIPACRTLKSISPLGLRQCSISFNQVAALCGSSERPAPTKSHLLISLARRRLVITYIHVVFHYR
jgi:hypothetical protein